MKRNQRFRRIMSIMLCIALIFTSSPEVFAVGLEALSQIDIELKPKASETKSDAKVQKVIDLIDDIGTVEYTDESLGKIVAAEKAYAALNTEQKEKVTNYGTLKAARNAYDVMAAAAEDTSALEVTDSGTINSTVKWTVYTNGILEISGTGSIPTYSSGSAPWYQYRTSIKKIIVRDTITGISNGAFYGCSNVASVTLPFVGSSRTATGPSSSFGYIFGYSAKTGYDGFETTESSSYNSSYGGYLSKIYFSQNIYDGTSSSNVNASGSTDYKYGTKYSSYKYSNTYRVSTSNSTAFVDYYVGTTTGNGWYTCFDYYQTSSYVSGSYWIRTYYYNTPTTLKTVNITDATKVEDAAFNGCAYITDINLNEGITSIGDYTFRRNTALKDFAIPDSVSEIGTYAFYNDTSLAEIYIPDAVTTISDYMFYGCSKLTKLTISRYATSIGNYAFYGCSALPKINIPNKVTTVGENAFQNCTSATTIYIPDSVKTIKTYAFSGCSAVTKIEIPDSVTSLGTYAFSGCTKATSLTIGSGVKTISSYAFSNCSSLTELVVPDTVTNINNAAFAGCNKLEEVTLPFVGASRTATGPSSAFGYIFGYSAKTGYDGYKATESSSYSSTYGTYPYSLYFSQTIYNGASGATQSAYGSTGYVHTSSAAYRYKNTYRVSTTNSTAFVDSRVGTTTGNGWYTCFDYNQTSSYVSGSYWIRTYYYNTPTTLKTVNITDATKVEDAAFNGCAYITDINLNEGITSIGDYTFRRNTALKDFAIPDSVSEIGTYAFYNDTSLAEIYIPDAVTTISDYMFYGCSKLTKLTISRYATSIGNYAFYGCSALPKINIPNKVTTVGENAFQNCTSATTIYIPDSVKTIKTYAFSGCSAVTKIEIPDSVTSLGTYAFSGCTKATSLTIGSGVKTISSYAFSNCSSLTELVVPDTVTNINNAAFAGCNKLEEVTLPFVGASRTATGPSSAFGYIFGYSAKTGYDGYKATESSSYSSTYGTYPYSLYFSQTIYNGASGATQSAYGSTGYVHTSSAAYRYKNTYRVSTTNSTAFVDSRVGTTTGNGWYTCFDYNQTSSYVSGSYWIRTYYYNTPTTLKTVNITDANKIEDAAFNGCTYITDINLNTEISSVGAYVFRNNPWYNALTDEFVVEGDGVLIKYNGTKSGITINDDINYIAGTVFQNNTKISEVTLHDNLKGIGREAFSGCSNLTSLTIPKSVTFIGTSAIPSTCKIYVYRPSAGYDYRSTNRVVLNAYYTTGNDTFYYVVKADGNIEIIGCETTSTEITVPTDIDGVVVDEIGDYGFKNCTTLNSITIPNNIINIGDYAFLGCTGLVNATIPTTVNNVGEYAFKNCTGLVNVTISEGVENLGEGVFYNCTSLVEAVVPDTAKTVGAYAFYNCDSMTTATIGITADAIGEYTFYGCEKLNTIVIGISVESIGDYAFYNCALTRVTVPAATTYIGKYAFYSNNPMTKATLRKGIVEIDDFAFAECTSMESINFPSSITTIGKGSFENCSSLASLSLPTSLTSLGSYAFSGCSSIPSVTIPVGVTVLNDDVFNKCTSLATVTINGNVTSIGFEAFRECAFAEIVLPSTVETIKGAAFRGCKNLTSIIIPDATTTIGEAAFFDCTALGNVSVSDSVTSVGKSAFKNNNDLTVSIRYLSGTIADSMLEQQGVCHVVIDENITAVGDKVFAFCYDLETITYGENTVNNGEFLFSPSIVSIGDEAFKDATLLKNLLVPDTIQSIGTNVFYNSIESPYNCKDVTVTFYYVAGSIAAEILKSQKVSHIVVNDNIHTLGDKAFNTCDILETVSLPDTITTCGSDVFAASSGAVTAYFRGVDGTVDANVYKAKTKGLTYLVFDENVNTIGESAFANTNTVKGIIVNDTDLIDNYAFANSTSLDGVVIVKAGTVDDYAFNNCNGLDYVEIGTAERIGKYSFADCTTKEIELDNINTIDDYAFSNCVLMEDVYIDSVININDYAFFNCIAIDNIKIEEDLVHIGEHAFEECKLIPSLVLPETTREIGAYAFYNCNSLASINIPVGVQTINDYTFFGCASLKAMLLPNTVTSIGDYAYYGCVLIKDLELGDSIVTIGEYAFYNCNQVQMIKLPETVTTIGNYAFRSCSGITEIYLPDSVTTLGDCVFYGCTGLEQVEFGNQITSIGDRVFYACVALDKLILNGEVDNIHDLAFYGAEEATIHAFENEYVETYCNDMGLTYYNMNLDFTMVLTAPTKTEYNEYEELDLTGLALDLTYTNGLERTIKTGYTVSGYDPAQLGTQTVTITYNGQSATFDVNVTAKVVSFVQITAGAPTETIVGEELDCSNMVVTVTFTDSTSVELTEGYTVTGYDAEAIGEQIITVSYREGSKEMTVIVKDYVRGDTNGDGLVTMKDVTRLVNYLNDDTIAVIDKALDVNGDGLVTIKDVTRLTEYLEDNTVEIF